MTRFFRLVRLVLRPFVFGVAGLLLVHVDGLRQIERALGLAAQRLRQFAGRLGAERHAPPELLQESFFVLVFFVNVDGCFVINGGSVLGELNVLVRLSAVTSWVVSGRLFRAGKFWRFQRCGKRFVIFDLFCKHAGKT